MKRGSLKVYLGMAPGVGKTYAMLDEGQRRRKRGTDVVAGLIETHGRAHTAEVLAGLELVARRVLPYRGTTFEEMDVDAILARRPRLALVDELAHTNIPGSRHEKRWQDIEDLLAAGIDVISTLNIQHLESLNDVVARITGAVQRETVPDDVVRRADTIEIVDISPDALRRRMAHGNIYPAERIDAALANYFRPGNLNALRELALLWVAERVDEVLQKYRDSHGISEPWEARERIVAALTGGPEGATLLRRAARIAARSVGADLLAVHVVRSDGLHGDNPAALAEQRLLAESLGGTWHQVVGDDVATALVDFARAQNATQLVLGVTRHSPLAALLGGESIEAKVTRLSEHIDVHLVTHEHAGRQRHWLNPPAEAPTSPLSRARRWQGFVLAVLVLPLLTWLLHEATADLNLAGDVLLYLMAVIAVAVVGGLWPALFASVAAGLLLTYYFTEPRYTLIIASIENAIAVVVFVVVAALVAWLVERVARRSHQAARASAEAAMLSGLAGTVLRGETSVTAILERAREAFGLDGLALQERPAPEAEFETVACAGDVPAARAHQVELGELRRLVVVGEPPVEADRVFAVFAAQAVVARERELLTAHAARAEQMAAIDRVRTSLLTAVSHDLRTPLASATAAVSSLRSPGIRWSDRDRDELLDTADQSLTRLARLIENLLDMSRLQAGALPVNPVPLALDELIPTVLDSLDLMTPAPVIDIPGTLPEVLADAPLLERIVANLVANAAKFNPPGTPLAITASTLGNVVEVRVIDHGPGIRAEDRDRVMRPFQRLGDHDNTTGVGLGLALAQGLAESMGGSLTLDDTPGGGLTAVVSLPVATLTLVDTGRPQ